MLLLLLYLLGFTLQAGHALIQIGTTISPSGGSGVAGSRAKNSIAMWTDMVNIAGYDSWARACSHH
ncbi:hypothetical protein EON66_05750 [archaeon]|nr:MAG: hypothetical protein EON66_05750 [archaeon]